MRFAGDINKMPDLRRKGYIMGPIAGKPDGNRAAFLKAANLILNRGEIAVNPHDIPPWEHPGRECPSVYGYPSGEGHDGGCHFRADIAEMVTCNFIYRLKGWNRSKGAMIEYGIATKLGLEIEDEDE